MAKKSVIWLIGWYQRLLSPDHSWMRIFFPSGVCRYHPTCSAYTTQAVQHFGVVKGLTLGIRRVSRCHPWHVGGFDPIPDKRVR